MPKFTVTNPDFDDIEYEVVEKPYFGKRMCARVVYKNCLGADHETPRVFSSIAEAEDHVEHELNFTVGFWSDQLSDRNRAVVCGGTHYRIGATTIAKPVHRGFGGSPFTFIDIATGDVTKSTNVWFQGVIPAFARRAFPDTHTMGG